MPSAIWTTALLSLMRSAVVSFRAVLFSLATSNIKSQNNAKFQASLVDIEQVELDRFLDSVKAIFTSTDFFHISVRLEKKICRIVGLLVALLEILCGGTYFAYGANWRSTI